MKKYVWRNMSVLLNQFISLPQLPKASDTSALSGAGFMRLVKNVGDSISKIATKKAETDSVSWKSYPLPPA